MERAAAVKFTCSCTVSLLEHEVHIASSHAFIHTYVFSVSIRLCRLRSLHTVEHSVYRGCVRVLDMGCLPAFLGDPLLSGCEPFSPFWGPFLRRTFPYLDALPRVLKRSACAQGSCQVLLRDSSCLRAPGIRENGFGGPGWLDAGPAKFKQPRCLVPAGRSWGGGKLWRDCRELQELGRELG